MTEPVSPEQQEKTRKSAAQIRSDILRRLSQVTQTRAAEKMGVHSSTVSRFVADDLERFTRVMMEYTAWGENSSHGFMDIRRLISLLSSTINRIQKK